MLFCTTRKSDVVWVNELQISKGLFSEISGPGCPSTNLHRPDQIHCVRTVFASIWPEGRSEIFVIYLPFLVFKLKLVYVFQKTSTRLISAHPSHPSLVSANMCFPSNLMSACLTEGENTWDLVPEHETIIDLPINALVSVAGEDD